MVSARDLNTLKRGSGLRIRQTRPVSGAYTQIVVVTRTTLTAEKQTVRKRIPIHVDASGHSFVSTGVWGDLQLAASQGHDHGFVVANVVEKAPKVMMAMGADPEFKPTKQLIDQALRDIVPAGVKQVTITR